MMRFAACVLVLSGVLSAQTLDGVVTNSVTGAPVRKANVALQGATRLSAVSDANGRFHFAPLTPGDYTALALSQGFAVSSVPVRIPASGTVTIPLTPHGVISGKIRDEAGDPMPGLTVSALAHDYSTASARLRSAGTASTDDRGEYRLFDLPPGRYYLLVIVFAKLSPSAQVFYPGALEFSRAGAVDVSAGAETGNVDFPIPPIVFHHVRGHAVDAQTSAPLIGFLRVEHCGTGLPLPVITSLHTDGAFDIQVPAGAFCLGMQTRNAQRPARVDQMIAVSGRDLEGLTLSAEPPREFQGTVTIEEGAADTIPSLSLSFEGIDQPDNTATVQVDGEGAFTFRLDQTSYQLGIAGLPPGMYAKSIRFGSQNADSGILRATPGSGPLSIVVASGTGEVHGVVQSTAGAPLAGARVVIAPTGDRAPRKDLLRTGTSGPDGIFLLKNLPPGDYRIFASMDNLPVAAAGLFRDALAAESVSLTLRPGAVETVHLTPVSPEGIRTARGVLP